MTPICNDAWHDGTNLIRWQCSAQNAANSRKGPNRHTLDMRPLASLLHNRDTFFATESELSLFFSFDLNANAAFSHLHMTFVL